MIVHNVEEGQYTEDKAALEELLKLRSLPESIEKHMAIVQMVADDYFSWNKLKEHLLSNPSDFGTQLRICENALRGNPKSYQPWHHRKFMMERFQKQREKHLGREDFLTKLLLDSDPRNFHCWNYRMLFLRTRTGRDLFNYSYLHHCSGSEDPLSIIYTDPLDPTCWEYFYIWRERRRMRRGMYIRRYSKHLEIRFEEPFWGKLVFEGGGVERMVSSEFATKIVMIGESVEALGKYRVALNGKEVDLGPEKEDFGFLHEVLEAESRCHGALLALLDYVDEETERASIIERIATLDPARRSYYSTLHGRFYCVYIPGSGE
ncbi:PROTEIN FARNESYL TRANSFERASE ALPHA SUBUNIT [Encephalitozoon cuniculi GB-M1]|uniref:PROTEIN FARNESYL TRANSFERASE ALPHA SUBUNIT n=1 Tax=Encephalitozoon cuniculi (strain GB-M1) TaxID=284813 RepID=Q8SSF0_ENCCU|nr:uncharacterized protein ECU02_1060 [Encephalitozoon cuniculi GB-M1]CAD25135.2 PROTEIN FARNESYL TRANSFERASE ALPHA SUBUNIT [Encephalitozoon cuniculi GB-M1]